MKKSRICDMLDIDYPIFQGAMAWVAEEKLASAVANAGGLGLIASGHAPKEIIKEKIDIAKQSTDKTFGVNIMLMSPFVEDIVDLVIEEKVKVITTGAGSPGKYMKRFKEAGIIVIPVVASVAQAKRMEKEGADAVVVEGMEGGGHIGKSTTMTLVPQVVDAVSIPVIAAGGIGDGRGVAAALMLGAEAVQLGTRFLVSTESIAHDNFKEKVVKAKDIDTVITGLLTGHPVRGLRNKLTKEFEKAERFEGGQEKPDFERLEDLGKGALKRAVIDGDTKNSSMMAGQIAGLIKTDTQSCSDIIQELMTETKTVLNERSQIWGA
ncbi:enoyl-[acyl-carrier-protein] reductase FabK [Vagococcus carniphilus]|uniref:Probable nitronate monooxygenase n=1 Tax=Vagococcus carniphilus TaxID=218144 RepID=A0AAW8U4G9_9ENTE|nr:enoyl-[acyl-carrier-protein] reductase FabK [Vagococcus carniphilus]MDT2814795.1 enoyl-[acyl-carrier-protein] reductase FabK [Vagococcus carniphilus]MDT2831470.1 enoyl-[acyl-carrier-protein] reductase FabK [Vagococcus carniphilus]MDT2832692.1 enoyl-[acyl-carrier-protein] reductase FabK [Vagococcus carniphilus]MDT2840192.1 enoyl-[acyl-carrier-protein] reductase FabK [Vagococcus carniphilus]MDT2854985.1 enoyl-[acyl-carrier-protein] reductase FabK [Vagococcus carniphilus]